MIDLASELLSETGQQLEYHEREIARLQLLRESLEAFIDQPEQDSLPAGPAGGVGSPAPASSEAVRSGAASAPAPAAVPSPPGDGSPAIQQPGSARANGNGAARPVGTPTPALVTCPECEAQVKRQGIGSHRRAAHGVLGRAVRPASPVMSTCPDCQAEVKTVGLGTHRRQKHGRGRPTTLVKPSEASPQPLGADTDRRVIDELCPKGCGQRFTWEPRLLSHASSCSGRPS